MTIFQLPMPTMRLACNRCIAQAAGTVASSGALT